MKSNTLINRRISDILTTNGFTIGSLTQLEEELGINGVTEFEVAKTAASGISDIIRLAKGSKGQAALGEEFAHFVLETMQDDVLVQRLMTLIRTKELTKSILGEQYEHYASIYNEEATNPIVTYNEVYPLGYKGKLVEYLPGVEFFETSIPKNSKVNTSPESTSEYSGIENIEVSWELQTTSEELGQIENYIPKEDFIDANNQKICD